MPTYNTLIEVVFRALLEKPEDLRSIVLGPIYSLRFYQIKALGRKLDHISLKLV